jgi:hypothetical protein
MKFKLDLHKSLNYKNKLVGSLHYSMRKYQNHVELPIKKTRDRVK